MKLFSRVVLFRSSTVFFLIMASSLVLSGCFDDYIDKVEFQPSEDLQTVHFSLSFTESVKLKFNTTSKIKNYGEVFVEKYKDSSNPFKIGATINTSVVNEQEYVNIVPTNQLPNGAFIPVPYKLMGVQLANTISPEFDMISYIDIAHKSWLGIAVLFQPTDSGFPDDLALTQVFIRDENDNPALIATVFGAHKGPNGKIQKAGAGLFINFRALTSKGMISAGQRVILESDEDPVYYEMKP